MACLRGRQRLRGQPALTGSPGNGQTLHAKTQCGVIQDRPDSLCLNALCHECPNSHHSCLPGDKQHQSLLGCTDVLPANVGSTFWRSSKKWRGAGSSSTSGVSFMSIRTSSRGGNSRPRFSFTCRRVVPAGLQGHRPKMPAAMLPMLCHCRSWAMILYAMGSACRLLLQRGSCSRSRHSP